MKLKAMTQVIPSQRGLERDRRWQRRLHYNAPVALVIIEPTGQRRGPSVFRAKDISAGGLKLMSQTMMYPGTTGAAQLVRSNGEMAVIGVQIRHCRYVGDMKHEVGLKFAPLPASMPSSDFLNEFNRMKRLVDSSD